LTPRSLEEDVEDFCVAVFADWAIEKGLYLAQTGRTSERTFSNESTNAERLSDRRNVRREETKRDTFPHQEC
jgi:hypothetical protein